jgi:hypothetical protein
VKAEETRKDRHTFASQPRFTPFDAGFPNRPQPATSAFRIAPHGRQVLAALANGRINARSPRDEVTPVTIALIIAFEAVAIALCVALARAASTE